MKYKLVVKAEAVQDMSEAYDWYESRRAGLGSEFLDEVDDYFDRITQNPKMYQSLKKGRVAVMNRFPFKIVYEIDKEEIIVFAVYHDKRRPEKLEKR